MSQFIEMSDYPASIHMEILDALVRQDETTIETCEDQAIAEIRGYLSGRYDCDKIFSATGDQRNKLVLMYAKDIALYHIHCIHNPQKMPKIRFDRYERAIKWLEGVSKYQLSVEGLPLLENSETDSPFRMKSNPKRVNHY